MNKEKRIEELKAQLQAKREKCKECDRYECGYDCEPKWILEEKIAQLQGS